ncbi:MAG: flagellar export protein FliJ [Desulfobacteraceae bacterium]|nr:MAG: flagellar export protein FliJ [Desulfobacteraceae bacterium]
MKRFTFKLQSVLQYREYLEHLEQQKVAKVQLEIRQCEDSIAQLNGTLRDGVAGLEKDMEKGMGAAQFRHHHTFLGRVESDIRDRLSSKKQLLHALAQNLESLKKKTIDKKVLERLRERKAREYQDEFLKSEQQTADETASVKKIRDIQDHASS